MQKVFRIQTWVHETFVEKALARNIPGIAGIFSVLYPGQDFFERIIQRKGYTNPSCACVCVFNPFFFLCVLFLEYKRVVRWKIAGVWSNRWRCEAGVQPSILM